MVAMTGALVGRVPVRLTARAAILDTGTTVITCSNADARAINSVRDFGQRVRHISMPGAPCGISLTGSALAAGSCSRTHHTRLGVACVRNIRCSHM